MEKSSFEQIREQLLKTIEQMEQLIIAARCQEVSYLTGKFIAAVGILEETVSIPSMENFFVLDMAAFSEIMKALESGDYVVMADYLTETVLKPLKQGAEKLVARKEPESVAASSKFMAEYTSSGAVTVAKNVSGQWKYLHANTSPTEEAELFARSQKADGTEKYIVVGLGLGYHIAALYRHTLSEIEVYEEDEELIRLAKEISDCQSIFHNPGIKIIYDKNYEKFVEAAAYAGEQKTNPVTGVISEKICLYYPSVNTIGEEKLRGKMLRIFTSLDNIKRWQNSLLKNFTYNRNSVCRYGDELKPAWQGKRIFLIAGGPSLDKNIHLLKERRKDDIVLTVGTSLKKCVKDEIKPDYVFTTDPKPECHYQFQGMETCKVPMILLSTAYKDIVASYEGEQYIIFQKDFAPAEQTAKEKGLMLYETGNSVTTTALDFCIRMNVSEVIFLGLDLANTGGKSHHSGTAERRDTSKEASMIIPDIYGNPVSTTKSFNEYRFWIEGRISQAKKEGSRTLFIDATEGGARVDGTEIKKLSEII
ncbi:MAG: motility associated factor glycosyltransferase family protein [Lachnospiraceae bacterium]|nr:motility associated factor glycosyltransferase family protein [Lachnospiraceae bacterium]